MLRSSYLTVGVFRHGLSVSDEKTRKRRRRTGNAGPALQFVARKERSGGQASLLSPASGTSTGSATSAGSALSAGSAVSAGGASPGSAAAVSALAGSPPSVKYSAQASWASVSLATP